MSQNLRHFTAINAEDYHYSLATIPKVSKVPQPRHGKTILSIVNIVLP